MPIDIGRIRECSALWQSADFSRLTTPELPTPPAPPTRSLNFISHRLLRSFDLLTGLWERLQMRQTNRSADFQSAVSRVSNPRLEFGHFSLDSQIRIA